MGPTQSLYHKINKSKIADQKYSLNPQSFLDLDMDKRKIPNRKAESVNTPRSNTNSPTRAP